jgi:hypothetical protein
MASKRPVLSPDARVSQKCRTALDTRTGQLAEAHPSVQAGLFCRRARRFRYQQHQPVTRQRLDAIYRETPASHSRPKAEIVPSADANQRPRKAADVDVLRERTTGFEPATPTLAKLAAHLREQP